MNGDAVRYNEGNSKQFQTLPLDGASSKPQTSQALTQE